MENELMIYKIYRCALCKTPFVTDVLDWALGNKQCNKKECNKRFKQLLTASLKKE